MDKTDDTPQARLRTLLRIPESRRTDADWDEIHELEISIAQTSVRSTGHRIPDAGNTAPPTRPHGNQPGGQRHQQRQRQQQRPRNNKK